MDKESVPLDILKPFPEGSFRVIGPPVQQGLSLWSNAEAAMCNLITNKATVDEVGAAMKARRKKKTNAGTGEVWKGGTGFVVRDDGGERVLEAMTWGFPRHSVNQRTGKPNKIGKAASRERGGQYV